MFTWRQFYKINKQSDNCILEKGKNILFLFQILRNGRERSLGCSHNICDLDQLSEISITVVILPVIVAAVLKVNEHQLLFVWTLTTIQQQDVSWKRHKQIFFFFFLQKRKANVACIKSIAAWMFYLPGSRYGRKQQESELTPAVTWKLQKKVRSQDVWWVYYEWVCEVCWV